MPRVVVFKTGEPPPEIEAARGTFFAWIREAAGAHGRLGHATESGAEWCEIDARDSAAVAEVTSATCVIITGSPSSVADRLPWTIALEAKVAELSAARVPMLGICFGHQVIAQALGGNVVRNTRGREMGTVSVHVLTSDPLFDGLPSSLTLHMTHVDTVERLPPGARLLATSPLDPHAAFAVGDHVRAVQFHPEFDEDIMARYVTARADRIVSEGLDVEAIRRTIRATDHGRVVIDNFFRECVFRALRAA